MKVLVSACLLGRNCKYNGGNNYDEKGAVKKDVIPRRAPPDVGISNAI